MHLRRKEPRPLLHGVPGSPAFRKASVSQSDNGRTQPVAHGNPTLPELLR